MLWWFSTHVGDPDSLFTILNASLSIFTQQLQPHHLVLLYRPLLSLWKMSRRNWYFSVGSLSVCHVSGSMIWVHADLYQCTLSSRFSGPLTENSSIGFQWGVFHLRQSSFPLPAHSLFDGGSLFWDPTFQRVVWSEIYRGCFVHRGLKNHRVRQRWQPPLSLDAHRGWIT